MTPNSYCGNSFGHELTFARSLELRRVISVPFEVAKVASSGSSLFEDWFPESGRYWAKFNATVHSRTGVYRAFVWDQGESEATKRRARDTLGDTSITYLANLTALAHQVRREMFSASSSSSLEGDDKESASEIGYDCPEQIPIIIVQLGFWPNSTRGQRVRDAQRQFCAEDPRASLVRTSDLSRYFHLDAISFLIIGARIARAYESLLKDRTFKCLDNKY